MFYIGYVYGLLGYALYTLRGSVVLDCIFLAYMYQIGISVVFTCVRSFYLTYPYQPMGKIQNGRMSIRDVIVMLK